MDSMQDRASVKGSAASVVAAAIVLAAALAASLAGGCERGSKERPGGGGAGGGGAGGAPPPAVQVRTVAAHTVPVTYEFVGQTQASKTVEVRARVAGFIARRNFEEGGLVDEGSLLFKIDDRSFRADLDIARATLDRGRVRLANAQRQLARITELNRQGAASPKELDDWQTEAAQAQADVRLAEAQVAQASLNLSYTDVLAPLRGRVGRTLKDEGAFVDAGSNSLLTTVWQVDPIYVLFSIPEREWLQWQQEVASGAIRMAGGGGEVSIEMVLLDGRVYAAPGRLDFLDARVDPQTGTAIARGVFTNPTLPAREGSTRGPEEALKPGQFVRARIIGWERPGTLTVPQRSVVQTPAGAIVMVVGAQGKIEVRTVGLGAWVGDEWIITSGLQPGDRVVVEGLAKAPPGTTVTVAGEYTPPAAPGTQAAATAGLGSGGAATPGGPGPGAGSGEQRGMPGAGPAGGGASGSPTGARGSAAQPVGTGAATSRPGNAGPNGGPASGVGPEPTRGAPNQGGQGGGASGSGGG